MTLKEVEQFMIERDYEVEITTDSEYYEGKNIKHTIFNCNMMHVSDPKKSIAWFYFDNRAGDIYLGDWTWYLNGKAYNSKGEYDYFEKEIESLTRDELENFINAVEEYSKS